MAVKQTKLIMKQFPTISLSICSSLRSQHLPYQFSKDDIASSSQREHVFTLRPSYAIPWHFRGTLQISQDAQTFSQGCQASWFLVCGLKAQK